MNVKIDPSNIFTKNDITIKQYTEKVNSMPIALKYPYGRDFQSYGNLREREQTFSLGLNCDDGGKCLSAPKLIFCLKKNGASFFAPPDDNLKKEILIFKLSDDPYRMRFKFIASYQK